MHNILQRTKSDCVIAAIAMVTRQSYRTVRQAWGKTTRGGLHSDDILFLLNKFGSWRHFVPRARWTVREFAELKPNCVVGVNWDAKRDHALSIVDGVIYCSSRNRKQGNHLICNRKHGRQLVRDAFVQNIPHVFELVSEVAGNGFYPSSRSLEQVFGIDALRKALYRGPLQRPIRYAKGYSYPKFVEIRHIKCRNNGTYSEVRLTLQQAKKLAGT